MLCPDRRGPSSCMLSSGADPSICSSSDHRHAVAGHRLASPLLRLTERHRIAAASQEARTDTAPPDHIHPSRNQGQLPPWWRCRRGHDRASQIQRCPSTSSSSKAPSEQTTDPTGCRRPDANLNSMETDQRSDALQIELLCLDRLALARCLFSRGADPMLRQIRIDPADPHHGLSCISDSSAADARKPPNLSFLRACAARAG